MNRRTPWLVGLFFFVGLAILGVLSQWSRDFSLSRLLGKEATLDVYFKSVEGLKDRSPVSVSGLERGLVERIELLEEKPMSSDAAQPLADSLQKWLMENGFRVRVSIKLDIDEKDRSKLADPKNMYAIKIAGGGFLSQTRLDIRPEYEEARFRFERIGYLGPLLFNNDVDSRFSSNAGKAGMANTTEEGVRFVRNLLNLGFVEKGGLDTVNDFFTGGPGKDLEVVLSDLRKVTTNLAEGKGTFGKLVADREAYDKLTAAIDKFDKTAANLEKITDKVNRGEGALGAAVNDKQLADDIKDFASKARSISTKVDEGFTAEDLKELLANSRAISEKIDNGTGTVGKLVNEPELYNNLKEISDNMKVIVQEIREQKGALGKMVSDPDMGADLKETIRQMRMASESIKEVSQKANRGQGAFGKLLNEDTLYEKADKSLDSLQEFLGTGGKLRVFVGAEEKYFPESDYGIAKVYARVYPRENRFFQVGVAAFHMDHEGTLAFEDKFDASPQDATILKPDVQLGYKFWDNKLTARVGILEGKLGAGLDYDFLMPGLNHEFRVTLEGRDSYADFRDSDPGEDLRSNSQSIDERTRSPLVRAELSSKFLKYFRAHVGVNNILGDTEAYGGIGFEYEDEDIKYLLSTLGAAKY